MSNRIFTSRIAIAVALITPGAAWAQDATRAAQTQAQSDDQSGIQDIVITAQHREERLQDVPIAVTAVSGDSLARSGVTDTRQLTQSMPSVVFSRVNSSFQPYIRGVGTRNANIGDESNVSLYIDGVYQPVMSSLGFDLVNVERIEVLRGPQGTLFGRNSTGGLINIITPDPTQELSGSVVARVGSYGEKSLQGYISTGIAPGVSIDLTGSIGGDTGYIKDLVNGGYRGDRSSEVARAKILIEPTANFRMVLTGNYTRYADSSSVSEQPFRGNSTGARAPVPILPTGPWQTAIDTPTNAKSKTYSASLQTRLTLESFNIETMSAYINSKAVSITDSDATTKPIGSVIAPQSSYYIENEIRALSTGDSAFSWIVGAFQLSGKGSFDGLESYANGALVSRTFTRQEVVSYAGFGEGTLRFGPVSLIAGARYSTEKRNYEAHTATAIAVPFRESSNNKVTYRFSAQYKFSPSANVYASYSRGFKSGVYNGFATTVAAASPTRPETIDSYEIGFKTDPLNWLRINGSLFHYDYTDIQQSARDPVTTLVLLFNAASAKVDGAELEATVRVSRNFNIRGYGTYLRAKYDSFPTAQIFRPMPTLGNSSIAPYDASGKDMIRAPRSTVGVNFDWSHDTDVGTFGVAGNIFHSAKYYWDFENRLTQPAYTMINGDISFSPAGMDNLRLSVFVRNLANEVVYSQMTSTATADKAGFERPRTFGASAAFKF
ncbi:TonB-dependent receptor [Sphingomonas sp. CL5.1]|uniref:TonB-dependent receptor n=1 Tax=Sphingomonas sp. CL5.1 TaxID=2653203 RepID=UPI0015818AD0|nr:TonB-dependent receptor [Sphingomonas sp. CL5.1]QKS00272.1 TonB-dependent receptor [Sphingomonas sp. CL5.1]